MKKILFSTLILSALFVLANSVYAEQCVSPTPPPPHKCFYYIESTEQVGEDSQYNYFQTTKKQVGMPCSGESTEQIMYEANKLSYNACLQLQESRDRLKASNDYLLQQKTNSENDTILEQNKSCNDNFALDSIYDTSSRKCACKSGYVPYDSNYASPNFYDSIGFTSPDDIQLACVTIKARQDSLDFIMKKSNIESQKLYPDADLTGLEKTSEETRSKIFSSASSLAYKKIKPLTANQIIENINLIANKYSGSPQDMQHYVDFLSSYQTIPKLATKEHPAYPISNLAKTIKANYPQYKDEDNNILVKKFIAKYPIFKDRVIADIVVPIKQTISTTTDTSKVVSDSSIVQPLQETNDKTNALNEPVKKLRWYQKIFNWFRGI